MAGQVLIGGVEALNAVANALCRSGLQRISAVGGPKMLSLGNYQGTGVPEALRQMLRALEAR